jgi:nucleotide-binding universal stress UspA family protein
MLIQTEQTMYKKILVPTDGSALSKKAIKSAVELASSLGAELVALNVVPRYPVSYFEGGIDVSHSEVARAEKQWAEQGQALADDVGRAAEKAGVKAKAVTVRSDLVAEAILAAVRKNKCDLVVMASHGRKGLKRLLLGSETQHVLTHGNIPVLVLR